MLDASLSQWDFLDFTMNPFRSRSTSKCLLFSIYNALILTYSSLSIGAANSQSALRAGPQVESEANPDHSTTRKLSVIFPPPIESPRTSRPTSAPVLPPPPQYTVRILDKLTAFATTGKSTLLSYNGGDHDSAGPVQGYAGSRCTN